MSEIATADGSTVRNLNLRAVVDTLIRQGPCTRAAIARETGLSGPTVSAVTAALAQGGLIESLGEGPATGGRRGDLFRLNARARTVFAVDLSSTPARRALIDLHGELIPMTDRLVPEACLQSPEQFARWLRLQVGRSDNVVGVGIGVPGVTDTVTGTVHWAPRLGWREVRLLDHLQEALPARLIALENDLNLAALGEHAFGNHSSSDLVMFDVRGGLGAGIILNGGLHRGQHYAAGEIGYLPVSSGERGSRDFGALETTLFDQVRLLGDETAAPSSRIVELLSLACVAVAAVLDVGVIVLGEEVRRYAEELRDELVDRLHEVLPDPPELVFTKLGRDGTLRGAGAAVHQQFRADLRRFLA